MDPITLVTAVITGLAKVYGSGIIQEAFKKFQAEEVSRKDFEDLAPKDEYSSIPPAKPE